MNAAICEYEEGNRDIIEIYFNASKAPSAAFETSKDKWKDCFRLKPSVGFSQTRKIINFLRDKNYSKSVEHTKEVWGERFAILKNEGAEIHNAYIDMVVKLRKN